MLKETASISSIQYLIKIISEAGLNYNTMLFPFFLFLFLGVYLLLRTPRMRRNWILVGNLVFYAWSGPACLLIVLVSGLIAYLAARGIEKIYSAFDGTGLSGRESRRAFAAYEKRARRWVALALLLILGVWIAVKVGRLTGLETVTSFAELFSGGGILVPLGISYYTLSITAYILDVYWQKTAAEHNFIKLFTAITYFPAIVQGPFCRYQKIMEQMDHLPGADYQRVTRGLQLMTWGYIKKLVIADRIALFTGTIMADVSMYAGMEIVLAVILGAVELYADFSGCMDIVLGISSAAGIELPANFRQPFFSSSAPEFWRRWHITLGEWTKEYIYLPIAMNSRFLKTGRKVKKRFGLIAGKAFSAIPPLLAVWLFTGLWHGTGWDYVCWGMYWAVLLILSQVTDEFWPKACEKLHIDTSRTYHRVWRMVRTFLLFCIGRMWTVTGETNGFFKLWTAILCESRISSLTDGTLLGLGLDGWDFIVIVLGIAVMLAVDIAHEKGVGIRDAIAAQPLVLRWVVYYAAIFTVILLGIYGPGFDAASFVYGNF